jgi:hypothetical protein
VWNSLEDIRTGRHVTQDFVYTDTGRVAKDQYGDAIFEAFPGVRMRVKPTANAREGKWAETDAFDINNNNTPWVTIGTVEIPPEGAADGTVNEDVYVNWDAFDPDDDTVTIAVDWVTVPAGYGDFSRTTEELEALPWQWATSARGAEDTADKPAGRSGEPHVYVWDSVEDAGTVNAWMLLRFRPLDAKREVGLWEYQGTQGRDAEDNPTGVWTVTPFHLDNFSIFTDPDVSLPEARVGAGATLLLDDDSVLVTGGRPSDTGTPTDTVTRVFFSQSQTTEGELSVRAPLADARSHHSSTRLQDGRVLIVGGTGASGSAIDTAEIYDPSPEIPTDPNLSTVASTLDAARTKHVAVLLRSGSVLLAGGEDASGNLLSSAEIFDLD